ncbi:endothelial zinc finger protein induced by tumor necrosis factor alpha-like isoform X2 [Eleginops maclovinus]|uniref:endothelial zinc finger protein induced by tumor necrosis factor alpha-like isoform X2 n=1 Tax=Eleginops maclovinus TaxID=56733 RepID=UPI003080AF90
MSDLKSFKAELTGIVSSLARALLTEICSAAERVSVSKHNPEEEVEVSSPPQSRATSWCWGLVSEAKTLFILTPRTHSHTALCFQSAAADCSQLLSLQSQATAKANGDANAKGKAKANGDANAKGDAKANGDANAKGNAKANGDANAKGDAKPNDDANAKGNAKGHAKANDDANGDAKTNGEAKANGDGNAKGNAKANGDAKAKGDAKANGDANVKGNGDANAKGDAKPNDDANAKANGDANAKAENQTVCVDPPPQAEIPDHEYALSSPPAAATASRSQRQRCRSRRRSSPDTSQSQAAGSPPLPCPQCRMLLPSAERLSEHQRKAHPACSLCGAAFSGILRLREHQRSEHGLLPFSCSFCSKSFNHKAHRELHEKARHTGEKSYHCDVCGKSYSCVSVLKTHRRTHFDRMFICDVCGKSFFHACHLTRHQLVHGGERPHRCSSCGRGFMQASNLRSHQAAHRGDTQLCSVCGKSYRHLKSHILSLHAAELPPPSEPGCPPLSPASCAAEHCPPPSQLREHQRSLSAEKPFSCDVGRKSFLRAHLQTRAHQTPDPSP